MFCIVRQFTVRYLSDHGVVCCMRRRRFLLTTAGGSFTLAGCNDLSVLGRTPRGVEEVEFRRVDDAGELELIEVEDGTYPPEGFESAKVENEPTLLIQGQLEGSSVECYTIELTNSSYRDGVFSFVIEQTDESEWGQDCPQEGSLHPYEIRVIFENDVPDKVNGQHEEHFEDTIRI